MQQITIKNLTRNIFTTKGTKTVRLRTPIFDALKQISEQRGAVFTELVNEILLNAVLSHLEELEGDLDPNLEKN